jgi:hypothetical protein
VSIPTEQVIHDPFPEASNSTVVASVLICVVVLLPVSAYWIVVAISWLTAGFYWASVIALLIVSLPFVVAKLVMSRPSRYTGRAAFGRYLLITDFVSLGTLALAMMLVIIAG